MGTDQEPRRRAAVETEGWCRRRASARRARLVKAPCAHDVYHGPRLARGSSLRANLAALLPEYAPVRPYRRPTVVYADAPRSGAALALSRRRSSRRRVDLAGPSPGRYSSAERRSGRGFPEEQDTGFGTVRFATGIYRLR